MTEEMESLGVKMFYCDPLASCQKPHVETNHRLFRYICPNKVNLYELGLKSQNDLDLVFSHINSYKREEYHFKSQIDLIEFYCPNSILCLVGVILTSKAKLTIELTFTGKFKYSFYSLLIMLEITLTTHLQNIHIKR